MRCLRLGPRVSAQAADRAGPGSAGAAGVEGESSRPGMR